ncbi:hypothetical protein ACYULU_06135 [Breznakiellaceae bacterium SP9]
MKANDAFEIIGNRLENDYIALTFKYSKSNKSVKKSTKRFSYNIFMSSFSGNIPDKELGLDVAFTILDKTLIDTNPQLFYIDLWNRGNYYNVATEPLLNTVYIDLKIKIEKYLIPFIEKLEEKTAEYKDEWIKYGFLHEFNDFGFCTNLYFINSVYGRESTKECLNNYLSTLDNNCQRIFKEKYDEEINGDRHAILGPEFLDKKAKINITIFLNTVKMKLLE